MPPRITGLHHVTATVNDAQDDLSFYAGLLGLRLVKQTVNFDNRRVFHFYYGNASGTPGTIMTTFPYKGMGVPVGRKGAGQITGTAFSIPEGSAGAWRSRLQASGFELVREGKRLGSELLAFADPSGLLIELLTASDDPRDPWLTDSLDSSTAIRGVHSPTLTHHASDASVSFLEEVLGFRVVAQEAGRTRLAVGVGGPGHSVDLVADPETPHAINGLGTVHHVAFAVESAADQLAFRERIAARGVPVTEVLDRQYFQSIYFREPGGVLYEIATAAPGFLVDEAAAELGRALKLPPWEEPRRSSIEAGLPAISIP